LQIDYLDCISFNKGEINYLFVRYLKVGGLTIIQMMLIEVITDPYDKAGAIGNIYSY